eukprot:3911235-Prymnesium_polylepis.2
MLSASASAAPAPAASCQLPVLQRGAAAWSPAQRATSCTAELLHYLPIRAVLHRPLSSPLPTLWASPSYDTVERGPRLPAGDPCSDDDPHPLDDLDEVFQ